MKLQLGRTTPPPALQEGWLDLEVQDAAGETETLRLHVRCTLEPVGQRLHGRGQIRGSARAHCHRCLGACERPVETEFGFVLQRGGTCADEEILVVAETLDEFDVTPFVREAVILEEPMRVLCRSDCLGLCAQCGQDQNAAPCGCEPSVQPRWEALQELAKRIEP